eukprot:6200001-Pleurochrysis_carterae.AAC.3
MSTGLDEAMGGGGGGGGGGRSKRARREAATSEGGEDDPENEDAAEPKRAPRKMKNMNKPWEDDTVDHWKEESWGQVRCQSRKTDTDACNISVGSDCLSRVAGVCHCIELVSPSLVILETPLIRWR